eukprot:450040-Hanusia_phi.AAC.1
MDESAIQLVSSQEVDPILDSHGMLVNLTEAISRLFASPGSMLHVSDVCDIQTEDEHPVFPNRNPEIFVKLLEITVTEMLPVDGKFDCPTLIISCAKTELGEKARVRPNIKYFAYRLV